MGSQKYLPQEHQSTSTLSISLCDDDDDDDDAFAFVVPLIIHTNSNWKGVELSGLFSRYAKLLADFYFRSNWGHQLHVPIDA